MSCIWICIMILWYLMYILYMYQQSLETIYLSIYPSHPCIYSNFSDDWWLYQYLISIFVSPRVQGIIGCTPTNVPLWESLYKPYSIYSPKNPREHNKYHGYTVRGTPNCHLKCINYNWETCWVSRDLFTNQRVDEPGHYWRNLVALRVVVTIGHHIL